MILDYNLARSDFNQLARYRSGNAPAGFELGIANMMK
jgi:hypothetical protein